MKLMLKTDSDSEKKMWEGETTWKREPTDILKRKHRLKSLRRESKNFTRVAWILDYGLRFRDEKGWAGRKRKQLRMTLRKN